MTITTGLGILIVVLGQPPAAAAPLGHRLDVAAPVTAGAELTGPAELLLRGGCLLRLGRSARARLADPAPGQRCATVHLGGGAVRLLVAAGAGAQVVALGVPVTVRTGDALVTTDGAAAAVCLRQGAASAPGPAPAPGEAGAGAEAGTAPVATLTVAGGQCLPLRSGGAAPAVSAAADRLVVAPDLAAPGQVLPRLDVRLDLAALVRPTGTQRGHAGGRGGSDVEAGSQSMCLETGSEGSAADPTGGSGTEVVKPLPPARLRVTVTLERR